MTKQPRKHDRMTRAYELRKAIYKFVKTKPQGCTTNEIFAALQSCKQETIRKSVYAMRDHGTLLVQISTARIGTVFIGHKPVKTELEAVDQIKTSAKSQKPKTHGNAMDTLQNPTTVFGSKTTHLGSRRQNPLHAQGGQGALRSRVYIGSTEGMV